MRSKRILGYFLIGIFAGFSTLVVNGQAGADDLAEMIRSLRQVESSLEPGSERSCFRELISSLDCIRRNLNNDQLESLCRIPSCASEYGASAGVDLSEIMDDAIQDQRESRNQNRTAATGGSTTPVNRGYAGQPTGKTGSSQTLDYEAGKAPKYQTSTSGKSGTNAPRKVSRTYPTSGASTAPKTSLGSTKTEPARCVAIESHPKPLQWVYADAEKYGLKEGCNGRWKSIRYTFTSAGPGWTWARSDVPVYAVVEKKTVAKVTNHSRYPVYFSVSSVNIGDKLGPGQTVYRPQSIYISKNSPPVKLELYVMWWSQGLPAKKK